MAVNGCYNLRLELSDLPGQTGSRLMVTLIRVPAGRSLPLRTCQGAAWTCLFFFVLLAWGCQSEEPSTGTSGDSPRGDTLEAESHDPEEAVSQLSLYPGLEATLFASEPMIASPVNMDIDEKGRVWVVEVVNYRPKTPEEGRPEGDRILILEDEDGDGRADTSKVYYQGSDVDAALGLMVLGNRVFVTAAPHVLVFTDDDGDDRPDRKDLLFTRSGEPQDDHSTHSFVFGPDGKFYWNMGNHGWLVRDRNGKPVVDTAGNVVISRYAARGAEGLDVEHSPYQGGMVFRCDPDGSNFEVLGHNFRNNYEVTVDSLGNLWQSDNDEDGNAACRINFVMEYGDYGYLDQVTGARWVVSRIGENPEIPKRHWHQNDPGVVPNLAYTGAGAPAGMTAYEGRLLPEVFWDQVLHCDAGPGVVSAALVEPSGAGYSARLVRLLSAPQDRWFRPVDVSVAPDGSVFVTDWYDPVVGWHRQHDKGRGRVFRIAPPGHPYRSPVFDFASPEGAVDALKSPNYAARYRAWTALHGMGIEAEPALRQLFDSKETRHRARALWLLTKIPGRSRFYVDLGARDTSEDVRVVSVRAARQVDVDHADVLRRLVNDPSPAVRRECALALRLLDSPAAPGLWAALAASYPGDDRWALEALGIAADGHWDSYLSAWLQRPGTNWNSPAGRDILWRSRAKATPGYLARILKESALDRSSSERFLRAFDFLPDDDTKKKVLYGLASGVREQATEKDVCVAAQALLRLEKGDLGRRPSLRTSLDRVLRETRGTQEFVRLVRRYELPGYEAGLLEVAFDDPGEPAGISAMRTLVETGQIGLVEQAVQTGEVDRAVRLTEALGNTHEEAGDELLTRFVESPDVPWPVREQAVRSLARSGGGVEALIGLSEAGRFPEELREFTGRALSRTMNVRQRERAESIFPLPPLAGGERVPQKTELLVFEGDPQRGREVFRSGECVKCHVAESVGTQFGPSLSSIGSKLSKSALYDAILDPGESVPETYQLVYLTLRGGSEVSGFILDETPDHITLKMEGGIVSEYPASDVLSRRKSTTSAMPSDLQRRLSVDDLVDLVEYLSSLKKP